MKEKRTNNYPNQLTDPVTEQEVTSAENYEVNEQPRNDYNKQAIKRNQLR